MGNRTSATATPPTRASSCKKPERIAKSNEKQRRHSTITLKANGLQTITAVADTATLKKQQTVDCSGVTSTRKRVVRSVPVEKLVQILVKFSERKCSTSGPCTVIVRQVFDEVLFESNREFADVLFDYFKRKQNPDSKLASDLIASDTLEIELQHLLEVKDDRKIIETYLDMYSTQNRIKRTDFETLLYENYKVTRMAQAIVERTDDAGASVTSALQTNVTDRAQKTIRAVATACFRDHDALESKTCTDWLVKNCVRMLHPLHQFCTFLVSVAYRYAPPVDLTGDVTALALATDFLNHFALPVPLLTSASFEDRKYCVLDECLGWILSATLEKSSFSQLELLVRNTQRTKRKTDVESTPAGENARQAVIWTLLYNSSEHGLCLNRFMYHVLAYRGPSVTFVSTASAKVYAIATATEWIESNQFQGSGHDYLYQIYPEYATGVCFEHRLLFAFSLLEHGPKMLYLNGTLIGGVHGLKVGSSARKSQLIIDADFAKVTLGESDADRLTAIETWGCGGRGIREKQLDQRAWTSTQIERQRAVKISADDWTQHPDRYLLNMAGRPQYNDK